MCREAGHPRTSAHGEVQEVALAIAVFTRGATAQSDFAAAKAGEAGSGNSKIGGRKL